MYRGPETVILNTCPLKASWQRYVVLNLAILFSRKNLENLTLFLSIYIHMYIGEDCFLE